MKMEPIVISETSAIRTQTPGNYPKRNKLHFLIKLLSCFKNTFMILVTRVTTLDEIYINALHCKFRGPILWPEVSWWPDGDVTLQHDLLQSWKVRILQPLFIRNYLSSVRGLIFWLFNRHYWVYPEEAVGFLGRKNLQHAFLRRGSKAVGPMS